MKLTEKIEITNEDNMELMARYPDNHFELAIVDPPYGINVTKMTLGNGKKKINRGVADWHSNTPTKEYFEELFRVSKNQIIWGGNYFDLPPNQYFAIWDKGETMYGRSFAECEYSWVGSGGTRIYKKKPKPIKKVVK
jgi:site-specific DNA-methyltransferase (adenine-specific)